MVEDSGGGGNARLSCSWLAGTAVLLRELRLWAVKLACYECLLTDVRDGSIAKVDTGL